MKTRLINNELTETFELIGSRMFNLKHCFELFEYNLQNDGYAENPVEITTFFIILKEYFNHTKELYNKLEDELGIDN